MASVSGSSLKASSELETLIFITGSSSESSRTSLDPSSRDNSTLGTWVVEVRIEEGVTTNKDLPLTACERVVEGSLVEIIGGRLIGEALSV